MRAPSDTPQAPRPRLAVEIVPMRRRHLKDVLAIERRVYPRPWSSALFLSEIAQRTTRTYLSAFHDKALVGYGGLMVHADEGHITTLAVKPEDQHRGVGSRLLYRLVREARERGARTLALEVRVANWPAQRLYSWFGFRPVGVRRNYYAETGEDALVMWIDEMQRPEAGRRLERIRRAIEEPA